MHIYSIILCVCVLRVISSFAAMIEEGEAVISEECKALTTVIAAEEAA